MRRAWVLLLLLLSMLLGTTPSWARGRGGSGVVRVRGYTRKDGTYVRPHYRSRADNSVRNNWTTRGNVNPFTGKIGTRDPLGSTRGFGGYGGYSGFGGYGGGSYDLGPAGGANYGGFGVPFAPAPNYYVPPQPTATIIYEYQPRESHAEVKVTGPRIGANLTGARLPEWDLNLANLGGANLTGATLTGAKLVRADLTDANLQNADLTGAVLTAATLNGAKFPGARLKGANLRGADLRGADLRQADLSDADLTHALYDAETRWPDGFEVKAAGAIQIGDSAAAKLF